MFIPMLKDIEEEKENEKRPQGLLVVEAGNCLWEPLG